MLDGFLTALDLRLVDVNEVFRAIRANDADAPFELLVLRVPS
jgi:hypothetical protein